MAKPKNGFASSLRTGLRLVHPHKFRVDLDLDNVAYGQTAGPEGQVKGDTEVTAGEVEVRLKSGCQNPIGRVNLTAPVGRVEYHFFRHPMECEVAVDGVPVIRYVLDTSALEGHFRVVLGVQEQVAAEGLVTIIVAAGDRAGIYVSDHG